MQKVKNSIFHRSFIILSIFFLISSFFFHTRQTFATETRKQSKTQSNPSIISLSDQLFSNLKITAKLELPKGRGDEFSENDIVFYNPDGKKNCSPNAPSSYTGNITISGTTYFEKVWSGFRSAGFTKEQTAGILSNILHEDDIGPALHEGRFYPKVWNCQSSSCQDVKGKTWSNIELSDGHFDLSKNGTTAYGLGLIQFSYGWRAHFYNYLLSNAPDIAEIFNQPDKYSKAKISDYPSEEQYNKAIAVQIDYMMNESYANPEKYKFFVTAKTEKTDMKEMAAYWASVIEGCTECKQGGSQYESRVKDAQKMYDQYAHESFMIASQSNTSANSNQHEEVEAEEEDGGSHTDNASDTNNSGSDTTKEGNNDTSSVNQHQAILATETTTPSNATHLTNHTNITFYSAAASENGGNAGKNADARFNNNKLADGQAAKMPGDKDLNLGDVIYIETTDDQSQDAAFVHRKYYIITDTGAHNFGDGKVTVDIFHDVPNPSDNKKAPYGSTKNARIYKVASSVSWDDYMQKYYNSTSSPGVTDQKDAINVKWKDGWIIDGIEGYHREDAEGYPEKHGCNNDGVSHRTPFTTTMKNGSVGPNKILLHSTEGVHYDEKTSLDQYGKTNFYPAHFMVDMKHHWIYQAYPITNPSEAIREHDTEAGIQIEVVGTIDSNTKLKGGWYLYDDNNFKEADWMYLAKLLVAISQETKIPLTTNVEWTGTIKRLPFDEFKNYEGVLGHMHATDNTHSDPGNMWEKLHKLFDKIKTGSDNSCGNSPWTGDVPIFSQCDPKWGSLPYGGSGTICSSGCGPSSFAMLATLLSGTTITPEETTKIAGDAGMHIKGKGSSHDITRVLSEHYGFDYEDLNQYSKSQQIDIISQKLREGWVIHLSGKGQNPFSNGGHFIGIRGITSDGKWLLVDSSGSRGEANMKKEWEPSEVISYSHNVKAIKRK